MRKLNRRSAGNAMIEFALAMTFLPPALFGMYEFGWAYYNYNLLASAVRQGARYASMASYDSATATPSTAFSNAVKNMVVYQSPTQAAGATPVVPGLTAANVQLTVSGFATINAPAAVTVRIQNYRMNVLFKTFTINKPVVTFPYAGHYVPPA